MGGLGVAGPRTLGRAATQPRRLALLALLAEAGDRGLSRDTLIGYFWPDQPPEQARHNLTQTLYTLRRDLGAERLFRGTTRLSLDPAAIGCDLWRFRQAIRRGDDDGAADAYGGPFLDGVQIPSAPELERWAEAARAELAGQLRAAIDRLASREAEAGNHAAALAFRRRAVAIDPHDARATAELARAMAAAGDRAGALSAIHAFGQRLRDDLALPLDGELIALADEIRAQLRRRRPSPVEPMVEATAAGTVETHPEAAAAPGAGGAQPARWPRWSMATAGVALGLAFGFRAMQSRAPSEPAQVQVAVLPFDFRGDSGGAYLGEVAAQLVAAGLDGAGPLRTIRTPGRERLRAARSPADTAGILTRSLGADRFVTGAVTLVGASIRFDARLHDASAGGRVLGSASRTGPHDSLFVMADGLSRQLLGSDPATAGSRLARSAADNTGSLAALRAFVEGEAHFQASRFADALAAFQRAVAEDSAFALAWYRLSEAADWTAGMVGLSEAAAAASLRHADRLSLRERLLVEGNAAWRAGSYDSAEARLRALVSRYPSDVEGWYQLGEVLFHFNTMRGRPFREAGPPFAKVISLDPAHRAGLTHLARVAAHREDRELADSLLAAAFRLMPGGPDPEVRYFRAVVAGDSATKTAALADLGSQAAYIVVNAVHRTAGHARDLAAADSALQLLIRGIDPIAGREAAANHAYAAGQFGRALDETDALDALLPGRGLGLRAMLTALPGSAYGADVRARVTAHLLARRPASSDLESMGGSASQDAMLRHWLLGMLAVRSGDSTVALARADSLDRLPSAVPAHDVPRAFAADVRAHVFAARGEHQRALELLTRAAGLGSHWYGWRFGGRHLDRWLRAELLERLGRREEALLMYESLVFGSELDLILAAPASLRRAAIFARLGRETEACSAFRTAAAAWRGGDPPALAAIDSARRALRASVRRCPG